MVPPASTKSLASAQQASVAAVGGVSAWEKYISQLIQARDLVSEYQESRPHSRESWLQIMRRNMLTDR
jgi:hypothetical protein